MKKILLMIGLCFWSVMVVACPKALPTEDVNFCASFKSVATCHCTASGLPLSLCQDMGILYQRMIIIFKSLEKACEYQKYTSAQDCIDNWNCYRRGGFDSQGHACSTTQLACQ
ncbi:MAG: hypothetical protein Q8R79_02425 [Legionellaceae bacterium]|nr:hypothetical protein [Legionellaceae bacterium]